MQARPDGFIIPEMGLDFDQLGGNVAEFGHLQSQRFRIILLVDRGLFGLFFPEALVQLIQFTFGRQLDLMHFVGTSFGPNMHEGIDQVGRELLDPGRIEDMNVQVDVLFG